MGVKNSTPLTVEQQNSTASPADDGNQHPDIGNITNNNNNIDGEGSFLVQDCEEDAGLFMSCSMRSNKCGCSLKKVEVPQEIRPSPNDKLAAVVVSICDSGSYDKMFTEVAQEGPEGTRVSVYQTSSSNLKPLLMGLRGEPLTELDETLRGMVEQVVADINIVDNDCVVFNWECCGGVSEVGFTAGSKVAALEMISYLIQRGCMVMCSDFSLKALIKDWDPALLGPNPFVQIGTFSDRFKVRFDAEKLATCPSSQLQKVGELCSDKGQAVVSAMSDTIVYTVDPAKAVNEIYKLEILTIVTEMSGFNLAKGLQESMRCEIGAHYGSAGHCIVTYPSGGTILTSAGHWLELVNLDVGLDSLRNAYVKEYGASKANEMMDDLRMESCQGDESVQRSKMQIYSSMLVQKSAPCKKMSSKYSNF